jgi:hypothetical protein
MARFVAQAKTSTPVIEKMVSAVGIEPTTY